MTKEQIKDSVYNALKETNKLMKDAITKADKWETITRNQLDEVERLETLYKHIPSEDIGIELDKAYKRFDRYSKMYKLTQYKIDELEQALCGLEKADYWL